MFSIKEIKVEYAVRPLGLDEKKPRFSWGMEADGQGVKQSAYRIVVTKENGGCVWDSGRNVRADSVLIEYAGAPLEARTRYFVRVQADNNRGETASAETEFETGLMEEGLCGAFISHGEHTVPRFFKRFSAAKKVKRARIYATALGVYELMLNGKRVGDMYDAPGWTSYTHTLQYQTYDVTELLSEENLIEALVAPGWYTGYAGYFHRKNCYGERTALCLDLYLDYEDGTGERLSTDGSWRVSASQIVESEFFKGETQDTTFVPQEDSPAEHIPFDKCAIVAQIDEPVRVTEILPVVQVIVTPRGERVLDFGQNMTGIVEFTCRGARGKTVSLDHAEILDKEGNFYTENLRWATAVDSYVLSGGEQTLRPHFTSHGFRYVKLTGFDEVKAENFRALVLHTDLERTGFFTCTDPLVDRLNRNIVWGQRGNFFDIPTDCPQRDERLGWTADAQVFCRTATFHYHCQRFYRKWLRDLRLEQTMKDGVPVTVPNVIPGNEKGAAVWSDAATIMPWTLYTVYGDKRILEEQYTSMRDWVEYVRSRAKNNLWQCDFQFGDWLALDRGDAKDCIGATDKYFIASAYYAYSAKLVALAADILGKREDAEKYERLHSDIISAFRKEYVTQTGRLVSETQTSFALALALELVPEAFRGKMLAGLVADLKANRVHLNTGFVGTPHLLHVLSENGRHDLAAKLLLNDDFPSWLYAVRKGATTVWERWNGIREDGSLYPPDMNSFNHYAYGSVGDWLYRRVVGIDCEEAGYSRILIRPRPIAELGDMRASYLCPYGEISVCVTRRDEDCEIRLHIPVNTEAHIILPDGRDERIASGDHVYTLPAKKAYLQVLDPLARVRVGDVLKDDALNAKLRELLSPEDYAQASAYGQDKTLADLAERDPALAPALRGLCGIGSEE